MHAMIGGAASSMKQAKRKDQARREKDHMERLGRPNRLLLNPGGAQGQGEQGAEQPRTPSRSGSLDAVMAQAGRWADKLEGEPSYGDECCDGKCSLLHFVVIFILAGVTTLVVGVVQYKEEAELFKYRRHIVVTAFCVLATGVTLFLLKCACFCRPRAPDPEVGEARDKTSLEQLPPEPDPGVGEVGEQGEQGEVTEMVPVVTSPLLGSDLKGSMSLVDQMHNSEKIVRAQIEIVTADY